MELEAVSQQNAARPQLMLKALVGQPPSWALLVGTVVLLIYLLFLPFIARTWQATGDEPHYLLAAHSLVTDLDYDLANNYAQFDYLNFYFSPEIAPQIRLDPAGRQILNHYPGLPFLIAPAYALGGRWGVLLFQGLLGGILAGLTFKLTYLLCPNRPAALLATLAVALSPPLALYPYLVYPELMGALLTTLVLYLLLAREQASTGPLLLALLALALLPLLNRRFIPLALLLALLLAWRWRSVPSLRGLLAGPGLAALLTTGLSIGLILWFNSQLSAPTRVDITAPVSGQAFWFRLVRGIGWLLDQQRGLLIYAPLYSLALWGLPRLLVRSWRHRRADWLVLLPFLLTWGMVTVAGGFWIAWEVGPRFLVVALPTLAPLLALAWHTYRRAWLWLTLAGLVGGLSLLNGWVIVQNPELPYKSSLPLYYGDRLDLPLVHWLPDLAEYTRLSPMQSSPESGRPATMLDSGPLYALPFGHYILQWPLQTEANLPSNTPLLRLSITYLGGGQLFNRLVTAADLPAGGQTGTLTERFFNPTVDRWRTPMILQAEAAGQARLTAGDLYLSPQPWYAFVLPYTGLGLLLLAAGGSWQLARPPSLPVGSAASRPSRGPTALWWLTLLLGLLAGFGYLGYTQSWSTRTYQAAELPHFVGRAISDPAARDERAWLVDPAVDPPQKAMYGPFDFYEPGRYRVTFRLKLVEPFPEPVEVARLQVAATAAFEPLFTQPLRSDHFSRPGLYHEMVLLIDNPRRQALSFELHYLGLAPLAIDEVIVEKRK